MILSSIGMYIVPSIFLADHKSITCTYTYIICVNSRAPLFRLPLGYDQASRLTGCSHFKGGFVLQSTHWDILICHRSVRISGILIRGAPRNYYGQFLYALYDTYTFT